MIKNNKLRINKYLMILIVFLTISYQDIYSNTHSSVNISGSLVETPLTFTENKGQWDDQIMFCANAGGATIWFTSDGAEPLDC